MRSEVIPTYQYRDARKAIEFLVHAFGFELHAVYEDNGSVVHAQLTHGNGMIMLGPESDSGYGTHFISVTKAGKPTSSVYILVEDPYAHAEHARQAGAEIVMEPTEEDYGGANYTARDPEGFMWNFGSYDPWAEEG